MKMEQRKSFNLFSTGVKNNNFLINASKSKKLRISLSAKNVDDIPLVSSIPRVEQIKCLGVLIDDRLTVGPQILRLNRKINSIVFLLLKLKRLGYSAEEVKLLYNIYLCLALPMASKYGAELQPREKYVFFREDKALQASEWVN